MNGIKKSRREFLMGSVAMAGVLGESGLPLAGQVTSASSGRSAAAKRPHKLVGVLEDAARQPATMAHYRRVVDFCHAWGLNALQLRLTDDQGSVLRFRSVPDLLTHKNAFSGDELRSLVQYGQSRGIELIPEVESFGHTGYITRSPTYAHLLDTEPGPHKASAFAGIIPVAPETLEILRKLYAEAAEIFPSRYLHGGCDEVGWGGSALSKKALQKKSRSQIFAQYVNELNQVAEGLGKELIVWGDVVLHKQPEVLGMLQKSVIVMDWNYWDTDAITIQKPLLKVAENKSRGIGAPALMYSGWGPRAGEKQLRNIDAFADAYLGKGNPGTDNPASLGAILTNWVPTRYVANSIWDGMAYGAVAFTDGTPTARSCGFRRFVKQHYGAGWNNTWAEIFALAYQEAPARDGREKSGCAGPMLVFPWSSDHELSEVLKQRLPPRNPYTGLLGLIALVEPEVRSNLRDFAAFRLSIECLDRAISREAVVIEQARSSTMNRDQCASLIRNIAERDRALKESLSRNWDEARPADSSGRLRPLIEFGAKSQLLYQWRMAAAYSASLAAQSDHFYLLLTNAVKPSADSH